MDKKALYNNIYILPMNYGLNYSSRMVLVLVISLSVGLINTVINDGGIPYRKTLSTNSLSPCK